MRWVIPEVPVKNFKDELLDLRLVDNAESFFSPSISGIQDSQLMFGVEDAAKAISEAIKSKKKIYIYGDFDVDGITSTSLVWSFLSRDIGANVIPFIPNRFTDGYGLSDSNIEMIIEQGGELIITVDCGIKDIELINKYKDKIDFVITDHHSLRRFESDCEGVKVIGGYMVSKYALAVVHPLLSSDFIFNEICGVFVAWHLCSFINKQSGNKANMANYLDLVALGTVCDVMPLIEDNRVAVALGLHQMRAGTNLGLRTLCSLLNIKLENLSAYHLGYVIGPRLNASGRMESALDGVRLLTTNSEKFAMQIAIKLDELNKKRQELTSVYLTAAESNIRSLDDKLFFLYGNEWPEGIIGLIAGKLTEKYNRPFIVGSLRDGVIKASARSIRSFNIAEAISLHSSTLLRFGGHAQAAGLSLKEESYLEFSSNLISFANKYITQADLEKVVIADLWLTPELVTIENAKYVSLFEPFGVGNQSPLFVIKDLKVASVKEIGRSGDHIKFNVENNLPADFLVFNYKDKIDSPALLYSNLVDVVGTLDINVWGGKELAVFKVRELRF